MCIKDRIEGCWLGKSIGGTLGLPAEGRESRSDYTFYDPVPEAAPPNDDLELQLVWLHLLELRGLKLTQRDFADAWLSHIHYMWDEYGRCRWNLRRGVPLEDVGTFENPFAAGMGSSIRSEIWACLANGEAQVAADYARLDASLDHGGEGIAGEVFFAVMQTLVLKGFAIDQALWQALAFIDPLTQTAQAVTMALEGVRSEAWSSYEAFVRRFRNDNFTHAPLNVGLVVWALIHGGGDFEKSLLLAVNAGFDTDCTAATVGATIGLQIGARAIPRRWSMPIGEDVYIGPGILDIDAPKTIAELTHRTLALVEKCAAHPPIPLVTPAPSHNVNSAPLGGYISIITGGGEACRWSNGELPASAKRSGAASWTWTARPGETCTLTCLAKAGASLRINDKLIVQCRPDLPFVPAPHRAPEPSRVTFVPAHEENHVEVLLNERSESQSAAVILSYPNFHLAPWSAESLPSEARLPVNEALLPSVALVP